MKRLIGNRLDALASARSSLSELLFRFSQRYLLAYLSSGNYRATDNGETALLRTLARIQKLSVVFDVGANVGDWTASVREVFPEASVHCIEAAPETAAKLSARFAKDPLTTIHCTALSDGAEKLAFRYFPASCDFSTAILGQSTDVGDSTIIEVPATTGKALCSSLQTSSPDFIKIDCEGFDLPVLRGFGSAVHDCTVIQFEHNEFGMRAGAHIDDFMRLLSPTHDVGRLTEAGVIFHDLHSKWISDFLPGNYVAVHRSAKKVREGLARFRTSS